MSDQGTLIHYGELALKKKNRGKFIKKLAENIEKKTGGNVSIYEGRLYMVGGDPDELKNVFGIAWYAPGYRVERDLDSITSKLFEVLDDTDTSGKTFGIFAKRSDKRYKPDSAQLSRILGQRIVDRYSMKVNLKNPDIPVCVEIAQKAFIRFSRVRGAGGLPVGVTGSVLSLLSGGIDSPVSSYMMMKRGCDVDFIHFHTFPDNKRVMDTKIPELARKISYYQNNPVLYLVPYKIFQIEVFKNEIPAGYEMVLFRSFIFRLAEHLARNEGYKALVTGDSLSQVASQTIENLASAACNCSIPVLQPLIGFDKEQIIELASQLGTYEISVRPYKECCSILSRNPRTRSTPGKIKKLCSTMNIDEVVSRSLGCIEKVELN